MEGYSFLEYHSGTVPGQGLLCLSVSTEHHQQQNPPMAGYAPYQPVYDTNPWNICLPQAQFPFQPANLPGVMAQPELAMDVKSASLLSPMTLVTPFGYDNKAVPQTSVQSPAPPPDNVKASLVVCQVPTRNESPAPPTLAPAPPPKKPRRTRRTPKARPLKKAPTPPSPPGSPMSPGRPLSPAADRKAQHSAIERKYRASMNGAMDRLRAAVTSPAPPDGSSPPTSCSSSDAATATARSASPAAGDDESSGSRRLPSKAVVLHRAAEEIAALRASRDRAEGRARALAEDRDRWKRRAEALWEAEGRGGDVDDLI